MKKKIKYPNIVRGGYAIPIYENMFLLKGKTHEEGGIDLGSTIEAETNEVMQINPKSIKIFSSVPFLNGNSPAELVLNGANPNEVFNAQEAFKDRHNLNDDGSRKKRFGDEYTAPVDNTRVYNNTLPINKHITDKKINFAPKELDLTDSPLGYFPIIGDVLQGIQSIVDVTNKNYKNALLNAGLLFIPNIIEKPIKGSIKTAGKYAIRHQISKEAALKQIRTGNPEAVAPSLALTTRDRTMGSAYAGNDGIYLIGNPDNIYNKEIEAFIGDGSSPRVKDIKQKYNIDYDIPNDELLEYFKKYRNEINLKNSNTLQEVYDSPIKGGFPYHEIKVYDNIPYSDFGYGIIPYSDDEIISYFKNANIPYELYDNRLYRNNYDFSNRIHNRIHDIITDNPNLAFKCGGKIKARNGIIKRIKNKISNIYWHTLRAPKDYTDDKAVLRNGKTTVECAKWANDALQGQGLSIFGDAWTRSSNKGLKKVYSGYDRKARPTEYDEAAVEQYVFNAADSLAKTMDLSKLQTNDIVGLYFRNSPNKETAYRKGTNGEAQTHTGNIVVEDGVPYVIHNVHGELIKNKAEDLIGSNHPYGIVSVYRKEFGGMKQYRNGGLSRNKDYGTKKENGGNKNLDSLVNNVLSRSANFVQRLKDSNRKTIKDWQDTTKVATHKLGAEYVNGVPVIYPNVIDINGELVDFTRPPYYPFSGLDEAIERGDTVQVKTLQDAIDFTENYKDYIPGMKQYKNGGLSRSKNYGSSKKPYPSVKSKDFAGGNRSYPIPTKADAVDALRLAGLHSRSDVKAKVYRKYPELRKKKPFGGGAFYDIENKGFQRYINRAPIGVLQTTPLEGSNFSLQFKPITIDIPNIPTINYDLLDYNPTVKTTTETQTNIPAAQNRNFKEDFGLQEVTSKINLPTTVPVPIGTLAESKYPTSTYTKNKKYNSNIIPAVLDSVGNLIDIGGNITSNILNRNMLNDLEYVDAPIPLLPTKLKTRININPQLERLYSDLALMENAVNNNTTSSRTALARNQRLRNQVRQASNELYGNKENIETQLINRDRLNQQEVVARNLRDYNQWRRGKSEFDNQIREALAENNIALTQGIGQSLNTLIQNLQQRNAEAKNLAYLSMSNPYAVDALNSEDFRNLYRMYGGFRCGGKKKVNRK